MSTPKKNAAILVVEDELALNEAYEMILKEEGFDVYCATNGEEALKITETIEPKVILLDLRMPKMGGIEFLKKYNLVEKHPQVQVIVFSNLDMQKEIDQAYELGAQRYVLKAWASPKELVQLVHAALEKGEAASSKP